MFEAVFEDTFSRTFVRAGYSLLWIVRVRSRIMGVQCIRTRHLTKPSHSDSFARNKLGILVTSRLVSATRQYGSLAKIHPDKSLAFYRECLGRYGRVQPMFDP